METSSQVLINTIPKIKKFANIACQFESEIDVIAGKYVLDGKSIMALFSINILEPMIVRIISDSEEEIESFKRVMEEFKYECNER